MPHRLPRLCATIDDQSVARLGQLMLLGESVRKLHRLSHEPALGFRDIGEGWNMLGWNNQEMGRGLWMEIFNGEQLLCFGNNVSWKRAIRNAAEHALLVRHLNGSMRTDRLMKRPELPLQVLVWLHFSLLLLSLLWRLFDSL